MKYKLKYEESFYSDLRSISFYISEKLENPKAADDLVDKIEEAVLKRLEMPTAFEPYRSEKQREYDYYRIYVGNYTIFYVVIGDTMEVRRLIYSARNIEKML